MNTPKISILTGKRRELFLKPLMIDASKNRKVLNPFVLISNGEDRDAINLIVAPLQFDEHRVKTQFLKLKRGLLESYMELPKAVIVVEDEVLGQEVDIYLTEAFKNNPDDIAVGVGFKNGILWAWLPKTFFLSSTTPTSKPKLSRRQRHQPKPSRPGGKFGQSNPAS